MNEIDKAKEAVTHIEEVLHGYSCRYTIENDSIDGLNLMDKLVAPDATDISTGRQEIEALAEYLYDNIDPDIAGYKAAQPQWVRVSDRLPNGALTNVLVSLENGSVFVCTYSNLTDRWFVAGIGEVVTNNPVIAWMPLPDPYTADEENTDDN